MSSRTQGACVLAGLVVVAVAALFAVSVAVGSLLLWGWGTVALWRSVRRTANPAPPPGDGTPLDGEEAGQSGSGAIRREGMLIYLTEDPDNPHRTRVHVERDNDATE